MARNFLIGITFDGDTIYLTDDGTNTGRRCRTQVANVDTLFESGSGNTTVASNGSAFTEQPLNGGGGRPFEIFIPNCPTDRYEDLRAMFTDAGATGEFSVSVDGEQGTATVPAIQHWNPVPIGFEGPFSSAAANIKGVRLRFITTAV